VLLLLIPDHEIPLQMHPELICKKRKKEITHQKKREKILIRQKLNGNSSANAPCTHLTDEKQKKIIFFKSQCPSTCPL
jgi:hypothetical protein